MEPTTPIVTPTDPPKYIDNVYKTLQENIDGFSKTPEEFSKAMQDSAYAANVYKTLKDDIEGFTKTDVEFYDAVGLKKKEPTQSVWGNPTPDDSDVSTGLSSGASMGLVKQPVASSLSKSASPSPSGSEPTNVLDVKGTLAAEKHGYQQKLAKVTPEQRNIAITALATGDLSKANPDALNLVIDQSKRAGREKTAEAKAAEKAQLPEMLQNVPDDYYGTGMATQDALHAFNRGVMTIPENVLKGIGITSKAIDDLFLDENEEIPIDEYATYKAGQNIREYSEQMYKSTPEFKETYFNTLGEGLGGMVGMFTPGTALAGASKFAASVATTLTAGTTGGVGEYDAALRMANEINNTDKKTYIEKYARTPEEVKSYSEQYDFVKGKDANNLAFETFLFNFAVGQTDRIPVAMNGVKMREGLIPILGQKKADNFVTSFLKGFATEGGQEALQQMATDYNANDVMKINRNWLENASSAAMTGGLLGAGQRMMSSLITRKLSDPKISQEEKTKLKESQFLNNKLGEKIANAQPDEVVKPAVSEEAKKLYQQKKELETKIAKGEVSESALPAYNNKINKLDNGIALIIKDDVNKELQSNAKAYYDTELANIQKDIDNETDEDIKAELTARKYELESQKLLAEEKANTTPYTGEATELQGIEVTAKSELPPMEQKQGDKALVEPIKYDVVLENGTQVTDFKSKEEAEIFAEKQGGKVEPIFAPTEKDITLSPNGKEVSFVIKGEEITIDIPKDLQEAIQSANDVDRIRAEEILRDQANKKYQDEINNSIITEAAPEAAAQATQPKTETNGQEKGQGKGLLSSELPTESQAATQMGGEPVDKKVQSDAKAKMMIEVDVVKEAYSQGKRDQRLTDKEKAAKLKEAKSQLAKIVNTNMKNISNASDKTIGSLVKRIVEAETDKQLDKAFDYVQKVANDGEYLNKLSSANDYRSKIKGQAKSKKLPSNITEAYSQFSKIDPNKVENIDAYNDIAERIVADRTKVKPDGFAAKVADIVAFSEKAATQIEADRAKYVADRSAQLEKQIADLKDTSPDTDIAQLEKDLALSTMEQQLRRINKEPETMNELKLRLEKEADKRADINEITKDKVSTLREDMDYDNMPQEDKKFVEFAEKIDVEKLTNEQVVIMNNVLDNMVTNGDLTRAGEIETIQKDQTLPSRLKTNAETNKVRARDISKKFKRQLKQQALNAEDVLLTSRNASDFKVEIGAQEEMSGFSKAEAELNDNITKLNAVLNKAKKDSKEAKKNGNINSIKNKAARSVAKFLIQQDKFTLEQKIESIQDGIERMRKDIKDVESGESVKGSDNKQYVKRLKENVLAQENALNDLLENGTTPTGILKTLGEKYNKHNTDIVYEELGQFEETRPRYFRTTMIYGNGKPENVGWYSPVNWETSAFGVSKSEKADLENVSKSYIENAIKKKESGYSESRIGKNVDQWLDIESEINHIKALKAQLYDIHTLAARKQMQASLTNADAAKYIGGVNMQKEFLNQYSNITAEHNDILPPVEIDMQKIHKVLNILKRYAVVKTLGGVKQFIVQTPVIANTAINLGSDAGLLFDAMANAPLSHPTHKEGNVARRGESIGGTEFEAKNKKAVELINNSGLERGAEWYIENVWSKGENISHKPMIMTDVYWGTKSWDAYYTKRLREVMKDKGYKFKNTLEALDFAQNKKDEFPEEIKKAASYADHMVDKTQNVSAPETQGSILKSRQAFVRMAKDFLFKYGSFTLNKAMRLDTSMKKMRIGIATKNKQLIKEGVIDYSATLTEITAYESVKMMFYAWALENLTGIMLSAIGLTDDEIEKYQLKKDDDKYKKLFANILDGMFLSTGLSVADEATKGVANWVYDKFASETKVDEVDENGVKRIVTKSTTPLFPETIKNKAKTNPMGALFDAFGLYGELPRTIYETGDKIKSLATNKITVSKPIMDKYMANADNTMSAEVGATGTYEREMTDDEQKFYAASIFLNLLIMGSGITESTVNAILRETDKEIKKDVGKKSGKIIQTKANVRIKDATD